MYREVLLFVAIRNAVCVSNSSYFHSHYFDSDFVFPSLPVFFFWHSLPGESQHQQLAMCHEFCIYFIFHYFFYFRKHLDLHT